MYKRILTLNTKNFFLTANPTLKTTPVSRKSPREQKTSKALKETPILSRKAVQNSITSLNLKSQKASTLKSSQSLTNTSEGVSAKRSSNSVRAKKNEKRRKESELSSSNGIPKKRKTDISDLVNKFEKVSLLISALLSYEKLFEFLILEYVYL